MNHPYKKTIFAEIPYAMGDRKGEQREALPLHSEHRLRRAQDINQEVILAVLSENY